MKLRFLRKRLHELDKRVEDAQQNAETATQEAVISEERKKAVEKNIVEPLCHAGAHNQFAELIRATLTNHHSTGENNA